MRYSACKWLVIIIRSLITEITQRPSPLYRAMHQRTRIMRTFTSAFPDVVNESLTREKCVPRMFLRLKSVAGRNLRTIRHQRTGSDCSLRAHAVTQDQYSIACIDKVTRMEITIARTLGFLLLLSRARVSTLTHTCTHAQMHAHSRRRAPSETSSSAARINARRAKRIVP